VGQFSSTEDTGATIVAKSGDTDKQLRTFGDYFMLLINRNCGVLGIQLFMTSPHFMASNVL